MSALFHHKKTWGILVIGGMITTSLVVARAQTNEPPAGFEDEVTVTAPRNTRTPPAEFEEEMVATKSRREPVAGFEEEKVITKTKPVPVQTTPLPIRPKPSPTPLPPADFEQEKLLTAPPAGFEEAVVTTPENLKPAARPEETEVIQEAEAALQKKTPKKTVAAPIETPKKTTEVVSRLDRCRERFPGTDFSSHADTDSDGLSNRTECYSKTDPLKTDTDGDSCSDGMELNETGTNPENNQDCGRPETPEEKSATITDPQPGWIVEKPEVSGIVPWGTRSVTVIAFPMGPETAGEITDPLSLQQSAKTLANRAWWQRFMNEALAIAPVTPEIKQGTNPTREPIVLGTANEFTETEIRGTRAQRFSVKQDELKSGTYDLIVIAKNNNGSSISSEPVRFSVDEKIMVQKPVPQSIGNQKVKEIEVEIDQPRPDISGGSEFGSQVFAVWESLVLTSSIIADSEAGTFAIQAPRELENDISHRVTLYAVKENENGDKVRSENVRVFFRIRESKRISPEEIMAGTALILILLAGGIFWRERTRQKKGINS